MLHPIFFLCSELFDGPCLLRTARCDAKRFILLCKWSNSNFRESVRGTWNAVPKELNCYPCPQHCGDECHSVYPVSLIDRFFVCLFYLVTLSLGSQGDLGGHATNPFEGWDAAGACVGSASHFVSAPNSSTVLVAHRAK